MLLGDRLAVPHNHPYWLIGLLFVAVWKFGKINTDLKMSVTVIFAFCVKSLMPSQEFEKYMKASGV